MRSSFARYIRRLAISTGVLVADLIDAFRGANSRRGVLERVTREARESEPYVPAKPRCGHGRDRDRCFMCRAIGRAN